MVSWFQHWQKFLLPLLEPDKTPWFCSPVETISIVKAGTEENSLWKCLKNKPSQYLLCSHKSNFGESQLIKRSHTHRQKMQCSVQHNNTKGGRKKNIRHKTEHWKDMREPISKKTESQFQLCGNADPPPISWACIRSVYQDIKAMSTPCHRLHVLNQRLTFLLLLCFSFSFICRAHFVHQGNPVCFTEHFIQQGTWTPAGSRVQLQGTGFEYCLRPAMLQLPSN